MNLLLSLNTAYVLKAIQGSLHNFIYEMLQENRFREQIKLYTEKEQTDSIRIVSRHYLQRIKKYMDEATEPEVVYKCFGILKYYSQCRYKRTVSPKYASKFDWYPALKSF